MTLDVIKESFSLSKKKFPHLTHKRRQALAVLTAQYNTGPSRIISEITIQLALFYIRLCRQHSTNVPLLTKYIRQVFKMYRKCHLIWSLLHYYAVGYLTLLFVLVLNHITFLIFRFIYIRLKHQKMLILCKMRFRFFHELIYVFTVISGYDCEY